MPKRSCKVLLLREKVNVLNYQERKSYAEIAKSIITVSFLVIKL